MHGTGGAASTSTLHLINLCNNYYNSVGPLTDPFQPPENATVGIRGKLRRSWYRIEQERNVLEVRNIAASVSFSEEKMKKNALFDSPKIFYDLYCLLPGQAQKIHAHDGSDKIYYVLEGAGRFTIGEEVRDLSAGHAVIARSGEPHGARNTSDANLVLLVTMAPPPQR